MAKREKLTTPKAVELRSVLSDASIGPKDIYTSDKDAMIVIRYGLTFEHLETISKAFGGTKLIDVGTEDRHGGYCETCAYSYTVAVVRVKDKAADLLAD